MAAPSRSARVPSPTLLEQLAPGMFTTDGLHRKAELQALGALGVEGAIGEQANARGRQALRLRIHDDLRDL